MRIIVVFHALIGAATLGALGMLGVLALSSPLHACRSANHCTSSFAKGEFYVAHGTKEERA